MAERDATVARGAQPRPVAPRQAGHSGSDQVERDADTDAEAGPEINGAPGAEASEAVAPGGAAASGEPSSGDAAASPEGELRAPGSPEDPTPAITGTAEAGDPADEAPEAHRTVSGEAPGDGSEGAVEAAADAGDGHAESPAEGPDEPASSQTAPGAAAPEAPAEPAEAGEPAEGEAAEGGAAEGAAGEPGEAPPGHADAAEAGIDAAAAAQVKAADEVVRDVPPGFPTEESLAEQDEATTQLRRAIDELRQLLDVDTGAAAVSPAPRRRRRALPLLVAGLVAVALVAAVAVLVTSGGDDDGTAAPAPTETVAAADPGMPPPLTPAPGTAPTSGPGVTTPGTLLVVRLGEDEKLHITEQAILPEPATAQLPLALADVRRLGGEIAELRPQVSQLRAALDGRPAPVRAADAGSWFVPLSGRPTKVALSYTIDGAVIVTRTPTDTSRVLGLVTPLLGRGLAAQGLPLIVRTTGTKMLGATCPDAPAAVSLCGVGDGRGNWTATVPESVNPVVVVQADLPRG